jgi:hypothetical protein
MIHALRGVLSNKTLVYRLVGIIALSFMAIFMLAFASRQSFWVDELWAVGAVAHDNIMTILKEELLENSPYNLPLYTLILAAFYKVMPYGEVYLLLTSIIFVVVGIIILRKAGKEIGGEDIGFLVFCIAVTSSTLITQGAWEIRPYAITFCFSSLVMLRYAKRLKAETNRNILLYGIALVLFLYCHWFSSILAIFYAVCDLCLYLRKKIAIKCVLSYVLAGLLFVPWFILMVIYHRIDLQTYWGTPPSIIQPIQTLYYLLSGNVIYALVFGFGFCVILFNGISLCVKRTKTDMSALWLIMVLSIVWVIVPVFVYSRFINPTGAMYVDRYFFVIIPAVFLVCAYGLSKVFAFCSRAQKRAGVILWAALVMVLLLYSARVYRNAYTFINRMWEPYRETAEYLARDGGIYTNDSLVLLPDAEFAPIRGWVEYYFRKRGVEIPYNVATLPSVSFDSFGNILRIEGDYQFYIVDGEDVKPFPFTKESVLNYDRLYVFEVHSYVPDDLIALINDHYVMEAQVFQTEPSSQNQNPVKLWIKRLLRMPTPSPETQRLFAGLRVYARAR